MVLKILGSFIALFGVALKLREYNPVKRTRLKTDLEILEKLDKDSERFQILNSHIDETIKDMYGERKSGTKVHSPGELIMGIILLVGFTFWSVYIYTQNQGFSWWILLTGFMAFAGFGMILNGFEKKQPKVES